MVTMPVDLRTLASSKADWRGARAVRLETKERVAIFGDVGNGDDFAIAEAD